MDLLTGITTEILTTLTSLTKGNEFFIFIWGMVLIAVGGGITLLVLHPIVEEERKQAYCEYLKKKK